MSHERENEQSTQSAPELSPEQAAFIERIRRATETNGSALYDLYQKGGNSEDFQNRLEDIVAEVSFQDETYAENARLLREGNLKDEEATAIAAQQREITDEVRRLLIIEAGLPTDELASDIEKGRRAVMDRLKGIDLSKIEPNAILKVLGILTEDEKGVHFTYPEDLFPESVNEKWRTYLTTVRVNDRLGRAVRGGYASRQDLDNSNGVRNFAHVRLTDDVHRILGLDSLPASEWTHKATRDLLGKMRDTKYIGEDLSESAITSRALARSLGDDALRLTVAQVLSKRTQPKR